MAKPTFRQVQDQVAQLLRLRPIKEWYDGLEKAVKEGLAGLGMDEIIVEGLGRVKIMPSERFSVPPEVARKILGDIAEKVIETKESVSNDRIKALVDMGDINEEQREELLAGAIKTPVVSLYVRPLK